MIWFILIFGLSALVVVLLITTKQERDKKRIEKIRSSWGQPKTEPFHFGRIERYAEVTTKKGGFHQLSRQTMEDIDFYELFAFIDRTSSSVGQQYLFHRLMNPLGDIELLKKLNATAGYTASNPTLREKIQMQLARLNTPAAYFITSLLEERSLKRPKWLGYLAISAAAIPALVFLGFQYPVFFVLLIVPLTLNTFVHYWNREFSQRFTNAFSQLNLLINVCERISLADNHFKNEKVQESISQLKPFQRQLGMLGFASDGGIRDELSQLVIYLQELVKGFLLIEVYMFQNLIRVLEAKRTFIANLFNHVGEIDTAISVASLRAGRYKTCIPDFTVTVKEMTVTGVRHPLVKHCVENELVIRSKSILITGSNMSGKSTFLRTLLINSILAQTIYTCFADVFQTPFLRQFSSVRIDDNVAKGTSYFFEEVDLMRALIGEAESGVQSIFILDEVFKGTNTVERVAAAKAILSYLNRDNNIVVVSTHDIELSTMLEEEYDLYHFDETFEDAELHFDHKLKPGRMKGGNAIRILALSNFPEAIIREAISLAKTR